MTPGNECRQRGAIPTRECNIISMFRTTARFPSSTLPSSTIRVRLRAIYCLRSAGADPSLLSGLPSRYVLHEPRRLPDRAVRAGGRATGERLAHHGAIVVDESRLDAMSTMVHQFTADPRVPMQKFEQHLVRGPLIGHRSSSPVRRDGSPRVDKAHHGGVVQSPSAGHDRSELRLTRTRSALL